MPERKRNHSTNLRRSEVLCPTEAGGWHWLQPTVLATCERGSLASDQRLGSSKAEHTRPLASCLADSESITGRTPTAAGRRAAIAAGATGGPASCRQAQAPGSVFPRGAAPLRAPCVVCGAGRGADGNFLRANIRLRLQGRPSQGGLVGAVTSHGRRGSTGGVSLT